MPINLQEFAKAREETLSFYSPYAFIRKIKQEEQYQLFVKPRIDKYGLGENFHAWSIIVDGLEFIFLYEFLSWDTNYFKRPCYKLFTVLFSAERSAALTAASVQFKDHLQNSGASYCFSEIPAEDIFLIQCLNQAGFALVETRLQYFKDDLPRFTGKRYSVREANSEDTTALTQVAARARNNYDRIHADPAFTQQEADAYLATYAAAAANGFCHQVLVPDVEGLPVCSFIAFDHVEKIYPNSALGLVYARLAAVAPENSGWYVKLLSEVVFFAKEKQATYIKVTTQATNRGVIRVLESLGFHLGATGHILALHL